MTSKPSIPSRGALRAGRILGVLVVLVMLADSGVSLLLPRLLAQSMQETGFPSGLLPLIGALGLLSTLLYATPATSVLGAILLSGFLGGAICTHLRLDEIGSPPQIVSLLIGIAAWASLYLRLGGLRELLPLTRGRG